MAAGTVIRIVLAFTTGGSAYDLHVLADLRHALSATPLHVYAVPLGPGGATHWPYAPGYFPAVWVTGLVSSATGLAFTSLIRLPSIVADAAIAVIVAGFLRRRGADDRLALAAAALVALGPSFIAISGYHGQIDSLAILPTLIAVVIWDRVPESRRALYAGALIGAGAALKTTPAFMLLALLPSVRSWREAATLVGAAVAVPLALLLPWLATTPHEVIHALGYRGFPGTSGLSIALQPEFAEGLRHRVAPSALNDFLYVHGQVVVTCVLVAVAAFIARRRPGWHPAERASLIWIAFYVVTPAFFFQYLVWGLPFFLLAGRLRLALAVQLVALVPTVIFYRAPWESQVPVVVYGVTMIALWGLFAVAFARIVSRRPRHAVA